MSAGSVSADVASISLHRADDGSNGALGFVNMQALGPLSEPMLLVGYATKVKHAGEDYPPLEFRIAKLSTAGEVLATARGAVPPRGACSRRVWLPYSVAFE